VKKKKKKSEESNNINYDSLLLELGASESTLGSWNTAKRIGFVEGCKIAIQSYPSLELLLKVMLYESHSQKEQLEKYLKLN